MPAMTEREDWRIDETQARREHPQNYDEPDGFDSHWENEAALGWDHDE